MTNDQKYLVEMHNVCKHFKSFTLDQFCLTLPKGEIMGLVGPNGAGKSTCLNLLMGFMTPDSGTISMLGHDIPDAATEAKQSCAFVSENMRLYGHLSIAWHMEFLKNIFPSWDEQYADHLLQKLHLNPEQKTQSLSLGQRIKATLLSALARRPQLLVLDEPSTGLDPVARYELTNELIDIMRNEENSVIFSSQYTQDVEQLSDTIVFMDEGKIISNTDKETYLDQWKCIDAVGRVPPEGFNGIISVKSFSHHHTITYSQYTPQSLEQLINAGYDIKHVRNMTLEEIFIAQVTSRRNKHASLSQRDFPMEEHTHAS